MKQFTITTNNENMRLSRFVLKVAPKLSNSQMHKSFRLRRIKVNSKRANPEYNLQIGDLVQLYINDEFFEKFEHINKSLLLNEPEIVWQNENIAILHKPFGLLSQPEKGNTTSLLQNFTQHLINNGEYFPQQEFTFAPALCNRLDRGTEGLIIGAKQYCALKDVNELLRNGLIVKKYLCITIGKPPFGTHSAFHLRNRNNNTVIIQENMFENAKPIKTGVEILESKNGLSLCEIELFTGRTHQIRAHLAFLGAPILGDKKYGSFKTNQKFKTKTQLLCAWKIILPKELQKNSSLFNIAGKEFVLAENNVNSWWLNT